LRQVDGLAGFMCLGSRDPQRFQPHQATHFLAHLAGIAALCLENAVNRERLRIAGLTDSLTGLYNRRHLQHRLEQELARAGRYGHSLACLFIDADHFKRINDTYGHPAGDQVLIALAQRLRSHLRGSDLASRYGGEEFAVLLPQTDAASACRLAERIRLGVECEPVPLEDGRKVHLSVSIGVAALADRTTQTPAEAGAALLRQADEAVYRAKSDGRNRVVCASDFRTP
jgi:diguanylate cyclase (GGDEF)-like protein